MSGDTLVFDMSSQSEGSPSVFVRKDWLSIMDNQNQNYQGNQIVIDTSQLANSNKYMNYREGYLLLPMTLTVAQTGSATSGSYFTPQNPSSSADYAVGLKNWYGSLIHSFTLDYNGTTVIQQTPYLGLWNTFKLMTSLSYNDVLTQGATIGFYPDNPLSWCYLQNAGGESGQAICNNKNAGSFTVVSGALNSYDEFNKGLLKRQQSWNHDPQGYTSGETNAVTYGTLMGTSNLKQLWKSYMYNATNSTGLTNSTLGCIQFAISGIVYLKHLASFFERVPLLKGVFMKLTWNCNQSSVNFTTTQQQQVVTANFTSTVASGSDFLIVSAWTLGTQPILTGMMFTDSVGNGYEILDQLTTTDLSGKNGGAGKYLLNQENTTGAILNVTGASTYQPFFGYASQSVIPSSPLGGVQPIMLASGYQGSGASNCFVPGTYVASIAVGNKVINTSQSSISSVQGSPLSGSVILNVPAYTFNPVFETSYLSSPVKKIVYDDIYQYQIVNQIAAGGVFNNLISNGISNIKSVLVLPFYSASTNGGASGSGLGFSPILSPFDPAGGGPTSPLCLFSQFNVQISGQNAIYNTERYSYEQFCNQLYGQNAVNGGMTDGVTSGLIDQKAFEMEYCYYYVNCGRMLPVEESVPKSINILGTNMSALPVDLFIFVNYGVEISLDILTGARV